MERLIFELTHSGGPELTTTFREHRTDPGISMQIPVPFEGAVALPSIVKLLNSETYRKGAFFAQEREYLVKSEFIADANRSQPDPSALRRAIGKRLFDTLLPTQQMWSLFNEHYRHSLTGVDFDIQFTADSPLLGAYPWELIYDDHFADRGHLVGGGKGSLVRRLTFSRDVRKWSSVEADPIRVLAISPRPRGVPALDDVEIKGLKQLEHVQLIQLPADTLASVSDYLRQTPRAQHPHVMHFDGHGRYGKRCTSCSAVNPRLDTRCGTCKRLTLEAVPQGYLVFETDTGSPDYVSDSEFADVIGDALGDDSCLRLVVLSACRSSTATGAETMFSGVAQRVISTNVPAVVAMQFEIRTEAAATFMRELYSALSSGDASLADAMAHARTRLGLQGNQWYRPVLYLRAQDDPGGPAFRKLAQRRPTSAGVPDTANGRAEDAERVSRALQTLVEKDAPPPEIAQDQDLRKLNAQLQLMADYKDLHDEFHRFALNDFTRMQDNLGQYLSDPDAAENFNAASDALPAFVTRVELVAARGRIGPDAVDWIADIERAADRLLSAIEAGNVNQLRTATERLRSYLGEKPTVMNERLQHAAGELRLARLASALRSVADADDHDLSGGEAAAIADGAAALSRLDGELTSRTRDHNQWQELDSKLRLLTVELDDTSIGAFGTYWPPLRDKVDALCAGVAPEFETNNLRRRAGAVDLALVVSAPLPLEESYRRYLKVAGNRFLTVDGELQEFCDELRDIGKTFNRLLGQDEGAGGGGGG